MKRTVIVVILAGAAMALLLSVALESRSVPLYVHIAQHTAATEVDRVSDEFRTLISTLESTWETSQAPGEGARALAARVASSPLRLREPLLQVPGNSAQRGRVLNSFEGFAISAREASTLATELLVEQTSYAEKVSFLRDAGPQIIQTMRDMRLERIAADTFQLVVGTVEYVNPSTTVQEFELRRRLVTLGRDQRIDANLPSEVQKLRESVDYILSNKSNIRSKLNQLSGTPVIRNAENVSQAVGDLYQASVENADQARLMLAIYAVVLFAAVGFIAFRLQHSYRDLNRANTELAILNEFLEQRVSERTAELAGALDDLKESQVQLVQAEKMSSLGQLVAGISHEINTPLLYLANNAALIQERIELMSQFLISNVKAFSLKPEDFQNRSEFQANFAGALRDIKLTLRDEELEANIEEAQVLAKDCIEGLADLTEMAQSLKDFSRLDRAPVGKFDINAGIDKTLVIARNIIKHKAEVRRFYGEIPDVECSPSKINQVVLNLITNAAQAIEGTGEIVITTKCRDDDHVAIMISDTGCGISKENLAKIRDPFFTTKEVGAGTGLGLSIVEEIVRGHGGELLIESELQKGSVFTVVLPIEQATTTVPEQADEWEGPEVDAQDELAEAV